MALLSFNVSVKHSLAPFIFDSVAGSSIPLLQSWVPPVAGLGRSMVPLLPRPGVAPVFRQRSPLGSKPAPADRGR